MNPYLQLFSGTAGISAIISYTWWLHQRVWKFRGELFAIRDMLWSTMLDRGELDDPSHRKFREGINAVIRVAPTLSLFTFFRLLLDVEEFRHITGGPAPYDQLQTVKNTAAPVVEARQLMCARVASYLVAETISGWGLLAVFKVFRMSHDFQKVTAYKVEEMFDQQVFERYNEDMSPISREVA